jgi:ATP-binding cassette subfamily B protein
MVIVASVMLAYDWLLALVAFVVAIPLVFVLRAVQRACSWRTTGPAQQRTDAGRDRRLVSGARRSGPTAPARRWRPHVVRSVEVKTTAQIRGGLIGAFLFPSGEVFSALTVCAVVGRRCLARARERPHRRRAGRLRVPHVPVPRTDRRVHRADRHDADGRGRTASRAVGARHAVGPPPPDDPIPLPAGKLQIDIRDVTFAYRSRGRRRRRCRAEHIDVTIPAGQQVAMVGATGSGKTTLGRLIARFADPTVGEIDLGGVPLRRVDRAELRRRLVVVSQEPFLFDDTVAANVAFADDTRSTRDVERVVDDLGVRTGSTRCPDGLLTASASAATSCRRGSGSWWRCCAPVSPIPTC